MMTPRICRRRRGNSGQAVTEFAVVVPFLLLLAIGVFDLGHFVSDQAIATGEAAAGITVAIQSQNSDVGIPIRAETGGIDVANDAATWGPGFTGGADDCTGVKPCGDPSACVSGSAYWTSGVVACYSVGYCHINNALSPPTCDVGVGNWGATSSTRPAPGAGDEIVVRVALKFTPASAYISSVAGASLYVTRTVVSQQTY
jgi:Flp pilus assembly protein TadG